MADVSIRRPTFSFRIANLVCDSCHLYCNMSSYGAFWGILILSVGGFIYALSLIHRVAGEPTPDTSIAILLICGGSSACEMAFPIWKSSLWLINAGFHFLIVLRARSVRGSAPSSGIQIPPVGGPIVTAMAGQRESQSTSAPAKHPKRSSTPAPIKRLPNSNKIPVAIPVLNSQISRQSRMKPPFFLRLYRLMSTTQRFPRRTYCKWIDRMD